MFDWLIDLREWFAMHRHLKEITRLATMSDAEFARRESELKNHPSLEFRALCSIRWTHLKFPGEPRSRYSVVAFQNWGERPGDKYTRFDDSYERAA